MSNSFDNRRTDSAGENANDNDQEQVGSVFEEFFARNTTATFYITIDTNFLGLPYTQNHLFPIFVVRDVVQGSININLNSGNESISFVGFVKELINNIRKKERIRKELSRNRPYVFMKDMKAQECTVCLNEFKAKQHIRRLDCEHEFHKKCIDKWLLKGNACCPMCRKEPFKSKVD